MQVYDALVHANLNGWAHLDVRPSNIIVRACSADRFDVMLIDWGCAHRTTDTVEGICWLPAFRSQRPFGSRKVWYHCLDHDLASLAYTVACLKVECIPWVGGFSDHKAVSDVIRHDRFEEASKILKPLLDDLQIPVYIKDSLLSAIAFKRSESANGNAAPATIHDHGDNGAIGLHT
jgi:serine/threonine protein kinase